MIYYIQLEYKKFWREGDKRVDKQTIFYCYRMTHDYGINPCVFTENYDTTPNLLTEGGCMLQLRRNIKKNWADKINSKSVDAYIMAVAGHSNDGKNGEMIKGCLSLQNITI